MNKNTLYHWTSEDVERVLEDLNDEMRNAHEGDPVNWHTIYDAMAIIEYFYLGYNAIDKNNQV